MSNHASDGQIDRLVKARWLALGLSQSDLAEVLGALPEDASPESVGPVRLKEIAEALETTALESEPARTPAGRNGEMLQSLLELRMLRAFRRLRDQQTKLMLVSLAEQMVKRQENRNG